MIRKFISLMILGSLMLTCFTGCGLELGQGMIKEFEDNKDGIRRELGELWNGFLDEFNDWTDSFATHSITKDSRLVGERKKGVDDYVGAYEAEYDRFTGEEFIFGGTSLKRKEGSNLKATYSLTIQSGKAVLYWWDGQENIEFSNVSDTGVYEFAIHAGKNFIVLAGEQFTGSLTLTVE